MLFGYVLYYRGLSRQKSVLYLCTPEESEGVSLTLLSDALKVLQRMSLSRDVCVQLHTQKWSSGFQNLSDAKR